MEYVRLTKGNIGAEHICCVMKDKPGEQCIEAKKEWLRARLEEGLVFLKANVRGKVFIEYLPAEKAWCPIEAADYMYINCLWVAGQFKGKGIADELLEVCISEARSQHKKGIVVIAGKKKMPFLSEGKFFKYKGFQIADTALEQYELLYLPLVEEADKPRFKPCAKEGKIQEDGIVLYYTNQCPYAEKYAQTVEQIAKSRKRSFKLVKIENCEAAQSCPVPVSTYSLFNRGKFVTHEILSEKKFEAFLESNE